MTDRLVSFVDFGPTVLSLTAVPIPATMQGIPFLGAKAGAPRLYVYGFRDRMDERYDLVRSVRDHRYKYIRNYMPQLPWFHEQHISYMYEMPTMRAWQRLADLGKLTGPPAVFMARQKPLEELYDIENDPFEVRNLAALPEQAATLERFRGAHRQWQEEIIDLGLLPEADLRHPVRTRGALRGRPPRPGPVPAAPDRGGGRPGEPPRSGDGLAAECAAERQGRCRPLLGRRRARHHLRRQGRQRSRDRRGDPGARRRRPLGAGGGGRRALPPGTYGEGASRFSSRP